MHRVTTTHKFLGTTGEHSDLNIYFYPVSCHAFLGTRMPRKRVVPKGFCSRRKRGVKGRRNCPFCAVKRQEKLNVRLGGTLFIGRVVPRRGGMVVDSGLRTLRGGRVCLAR